MDFCSSGNQLDNDDLLIGEKTRNVNELTEEEKTQFFTCVR